MKRANDFKKKIRDGNDSPSRYYFEEEEDRDPDTNINQNLYEVADSFEWQRMFGLPSSTPEGQLEGLKREIMIRVKITKNEIFKIGELLIHAKKICQQAGKGFQEWISNNLDFSYETAINFMNVYEHCLGQRKIAMNVKPSILYKISSPSFPDELRECLFDLEQLDKMTNGRLREITRRYKEGGGFEAIKDDIAEFNRGNLIFKQSTYTLDMIENALRTLEALKDNIGKRRTGRNIVPFERQIESNEPEALDINSKLYSALQSAIDILEKARQESGEILNNFVNAIKEKCGVV